MAGNIGARELQGLAQSVEEAIARGDADPARLAGRIAALEAALGAVMQSLARYFDSSAAAAIAAVAEAAAPVGAQALAQLQALLAEFSGEATDYFETVRAALAGLFDAATLARLEAHLARYEFEEARAVLAQASRVVEPDLAGHA